MIRAKKGVSPVIATLLLIVIAVAAAVVTYSWVMGFIGTTTTTPAQTQARIVVDAVRYYSANKTIAAYVRNTGSVTVNVNTIYVYSADGTLHEALMSLSGTTQILAGQVKRVQGQLTTALTSGKTYYIKVTTKEGASATSETFTA